MLLVHCLEILYQELDHVGETGLVLLAQVILRRLLLHLHRLLHHLHRLLRRFRQVVGQEVVVVGGTVVVLRFQGSGIASEGCRCFTVRPGGLRGPSPVLGGCSRRCHCPRSWHGL
jgi:hypothetical protein